MDTCTEIMLILLLHGPVSSFLHCTRFCDSQMGSSVLSNRWRKHCLKLCQCQDIEWIFLLHIIMYICQLGI